MATNQLAAALSPEVLQRARDFFANPNPDYGGAFLDPATGLALRRAENPLLQGYNYAGNLLSEPHGPGTSQHLYGQDGGYTGERVRPQYGFMDNMIASSLPALMIALGPFAASALGAGAAGAGAAAGEVGGSLAGGAGLGAGGAGLTGGIGTGAGLGYGLGTLPELAGASYGAGALGLDSALAGMGAAGAAGGAAGASFGGGSGTDFLAGGTNGDVLADGAISQGGSPLTGGMGGLTPGSGYGFTTLPELGTAGGTYGAGSMGLEAGLAGLGGMGAAAAGGSGGSSLPAHELMHSAGDAAAGGGFNWGSLIGPALNAVGGVAGANAAQSAANAQLQAAREAQALQEPFRQAGMQGMNRLLDLYGLSGNTGAAGYGSAMKKFGMSDFQADPGYGFRQSEGEKGLQRAASAAGGLGSGRYLKDAMRFNQGLASDEYGKAYDRYGTDIARQINPLQALMGSGQSAANTIGEYGTQGANAVAAGKVGQANAYSNALTQGVSLYQNQRQNDQNQRFQNALMERWTNMPASWAMGG